MLDPDRLADALYMAGFTIGERPVMAEDLDRLKDAYAKAIGDRWSDYRAGIEAGVRWAHHRGRPLPSDPCSSCAAEVRKALKQAATPPSEKAPGVA